MSFADLYTPPNDLHFGPEPAWDQHRDHGSHASGCPECRDMTPSSLVVLVCAGCGRVVGFDPRRLTGEKGASIPDNPGHRAGKVVGKPSPALNAYLTRGGLTGAQIAAEVQKNGTGKFTPKGA